MPTMHRVRPGDTATSIAFRYGFFPKTIEDHAENADLKRERTDLNTLVPGEDVVYVPDLQEKQLDAACEQKHRFRRKGVPARLVLRFLDEDDEPRDGVPYRVWIDGKSRDGSTDGEGVLDEPISPDARHAVVALRCDTPGEERYEFDIGQLQPSDESEGIQARLKNLGFECGPIDGDIGPRTSDAIARFQEEHELDVTGEPDQATSDKLEELHQS